MDRLPALRRPFLTAVWENLFLANFAVPDELLIGRLPRDLRLDRWDGRAFVSLVAFDFRDTRVFGFGWPGYRQFPEINLRTYVRRGDDRGVVFIREFVGLRLVAGLARWLYNEPYRVVPLTSSVTKSEKTITLEHRLWARDRAHTIRTTGALPARTPGADTVEHFFKEQRWGFGRTRGGKTLRYDVEHPVWDTYSVQDYSIDVDWGALYGPEWAFLTKATPESVLLAAGSAVAVYGHHRLAPNAS
jgi:uncharacterized protein